jgi:plastocyanin domain-containing protein
MTSKRFLTLAGAVAAFASTSAYAEHDHMAMDHGAMQHATAPAAQGIAEGTVKDGVRIVQVAVTDEGFVPSKIKANKGEKVRLVVTRKTNSTCAKEIVVKDHGINQPLPLDKAVTVEFTPKRSGEIRYACGMDMIAGVVFVP